RFWGETAHTFAQRALGRRPRPWHNSPAGGRPANEEGTAMATDKTREHVLVAGATGLVGRAAMEHFARAGYRTTAVSRRPPFDTSGADFISVDLADRAACEAAFGAVRDCTRIVFAAVQDEADLVAGWLDEAHVRRNGDMLRNTVDAVARGSSALRHVT